ncbi:ionotropic receptor 21a-like [Penaeus japonicus]|uniref:ionotropic receptor 21a-like n=1 Tax=Penaeus japonicus TaxID=27405 RepID=UPI001C70B9AA|nr:ionotropic receptor 21a-like [Penaeus japonicus]
MCSRLYRESDGHPDFLAGAGGVVSAVLTEVVQPTTSVILLTDGSSSASAISQVVRQVEAPYGVGVFEARVGGWFANNTQNQLSEVVGRARKERLLSWNVCVVVASEDLNFLTSFAEVALQGRLLVWTTKLLLVTSVALQELRDVLRTHWVFSMMNAVVVVLEDKAPIQKWGIYSHLPYSPTGPQLARIATWTPDAGLRITSVHGLFPEKFSNFYGAVVNVTALPFPPYWSVLEEPSASSSGRYSGTDFLLLEATAKALNFTFRVVPTETWTEVADRVVERVAFLSPIFHNVLPARLDRYEFSFVYEYGSLDFSMAKPNLKPQWQSLYYPLSHAVWLGVLATIIHKGRKWTTTEHVAERTRRHPLTLGKAVQEVFGLFLGQNLSRSFYASGRARLLAGAWLVFSLVVGTAYRGNLTASLTLPVYPSRPETLADLVLVADRRVKRLIDMTFVITPKSLPSTSINPTITMPSYGAEFKSFFGKSDSPVFKRLSELMDIVSSVEEGQRQAIELNQAHLDTRRYQLLHIAQQFTNADGTTRLYIGRESIIPGQSAWPLPHDAPYRPQVDRCIMAVIEAGLYERWSENLLDEARAESSRKLRKEQAESKKQKTAKGKNQKAVMADVQWP